MTFLAPALPLRLAARAAAGDHSFDPPVPKAAGEVGGDDVPADGAADEQGLVAAAADSDPGVPRAGRGGDFVCHHAADGRADCSGLTGGVPDTVIVLLDRSASMEQQNLATGTSKRAAGNLKARSALRDTVAYARNSC